MTSRRRSVVALALAAMVTTLVMPVLVASTAEATSYRYWTYWLGGSGDWSFSTQGPSRRPPDGSVEGWRFSISQAASSSDTPRVSSDFNDLCRSTDPVDGKKRVGLVLDFGVTADAPPGTTPPNGPIARCLVLPLTATGYDVLVAAAAIRTEEGLVCAVAGYPRTGCGEAVADPKPTTGGAQTGDGAGEQGSGQDSGNAGQPGPGSTGSASGGSGQGKTRVSQNEDDEPSAKTTKPRPRVQSTRPGTPAQQPATGQDEEPVDAAVALGTGLTEPGSTQSPAGFVVGLLAVAALITTGVVIGRRRR